MPNFKQMPMTPSQVLLFPMSVEESVPRNCDVRVPGGAMDLLDWSVFEAGYSETGCPPYPPKVSAKILVYGYSKSGRYREYRAFGCKSCSFYHERVKVKCKTDLAVQIGVVAAERQAMIEKLETPEGFPTISEGRGLVADHRTDMECGA